MCGPAELPGAKVCTRSAEGRMRNDMSFLEYETQDFAGKKGEGAYLCFGINFCRMLQQKIDYFDVSIVTAHMEWRVAHL